MHELSAVRLTTSGDLMCHMVIIANNVVSYTVSILWPPDAKSRLTGKEPNSGKEPNAGKDLGQEEKRPTEDEMVR